MNNWVCLPLEMSCSQSHKYLLTFRKNTLERTLIERKIVFGYHVF